MFLQQVNDRTSVSREWFKNYNFHLVTSVDQLSKLVDICIQRKLTSLDLESTGVDNRVYPDEYFGDGKITRHGIRTVDKIAGLCISFDGQHGYYIPVGHEPEDSGNLPWDPAWDEITRLVNNCKIIFHNAKFDCEFLYPVTNKDYWKLDEYEDTFLLAKVNNPLKSHPSGLKPLTKEHFDIEMVELDELFTPEMVEQLKRDKRSTKNFAVLHPSEGVEYGCSDGIFTYKLFPIIREMLSEGDMKIYNLEKSFCNILREMERNRVHIDVVRVNQLDVECKHELIATGDIVRNLIESHTKKTGKWLSLNVGSAAQLSQALITDPEGIRMRPTPEMIAAQAGEYISDNLSDDDDEDDEEVKRYSLNDEMMKSLEKAYGHKFPSPRQKEVKDANTGKKRQESLFDLILEFRHYQKMKGSYVEKLVAAVDKYGDVRPSFNQMGTDTCRLSCKADKIENGYSGVNFQGIPRDSDEDKPELFKQIRSCIIPRPGWILVKLDFAGEELRVVTNLSGDPIWTDSFLNKDGDVHSITAKTLFAKTDVNKDERNRGKRCNFAFIYGGGAGAIQRNIGGTMEDAQRHMDNLRSDVPILMGYVDQQKFYAKKHKCIYTSYGRKIPIPAIDSPIRGIRSKAERCAINYTIQATSADVLKFAMCFVDKNLRQLGWKDRCRYVLTVHDEVVYEIRPEYLQEIVRKLDEWMTFPWKLPKAHGRPWVVPLLTEPGIDINWKARYDYFAMVDGVPTQDIDEDGKFAGKLKPDHYFHNGRVYQEVPDFLQGHIKRLDQLTEPAALPEPAKEMESKKEEPKSEEIPVLPLPKIEFIGTVNEIPPEQVIKLGIGASVIIQNPIQLPENEISVYNIPDYPIPQKTEDEVLEELVINATQVETDDDISLDIEPTFGESNISEVAETHSSVPPAAHSYEPPQYTEHGQSRPSTDSKKNEKKITLDPRPRNIEEKEEIGTFRWTIRCVLSHRNMRKLHAVCILAEGETPLRVISPTGEILVDEDVGVKIDPTRFRVISEMMGLGGAG